MLYGIALLFHKMPNNAIKFTVIYYVYQYHTVVACLHWMWINIEKSKWMLSVYPIQFKIGHISFHFSSSIQFQTTWMDRKSKALDLLRFFFVHFINSFHKYMYNSLKYTKIKLSIEIKASRNIWKMDQEGKKRFEQQNVVTKTI